MTTITMELNAQDRRRVEGILARLSRATEGPGLRQFVHARVWPYAATRASLRFASEGDDASGPWEELKPATERVRRDLGYQAAHPINERTGQLRRAVTTTYDLETGANTATLIMPARRGSPRLQKKFTGAQQGEKTAPPRPVAVVSATDASEVTSRAAHWFQEIIQGL